MHRLREHVRDLAARAAGFEIERPWLRGVPAGAARLPAGARAEAG